MNYNAVLSLSYSLINRMYATIKNIDPQFYIVTNWVRDLTAKAYTDKDLKAQLFDVLKNGGTLKIKAMLLKYENYNENDLTQFNAFCLLDSLCISV